MEPECEPGVDDNAEDRHTEDDADDPFAEFCLPEVPDPVLTEEISPQASMCTTMRRPGWVRVAAVLPTFGGDPCPNSCPSLDNPGPSFDAGQWQRRAKRAVAAGDVMDLMHTPAAHLLAPDSVGNTLGHLAAKCGCEPSLRALAHLCVSDEMIARADPGAADELQMRRMWGREMMSQPNDRGLTPAHMAAGHGHEGCLRLLEGVSAHLLLELTAAVRRSQVTHDTRTVSPLHLAAGGGHVGCLRMLFLARLARVDEPAPLETDEAGFSPMHAAAKHGRIDCIRELFALLEEHFSTDVAVAALAAGNGQGVNPGHVAAERGHAGDGPALFC